MATSTSRYISQALAYPRLTREEELALAQTYKVMGCETASNKLIRAHLRQVVHCALRYRGYGAPVADLIAAGNLGLVHALKKFEPERGLRFATYAEHWVRAYVVREMLRSRSIVRVGGRALETDTFFKVRRDYARFVAQFGEREALSKLAESYDMSESDAAKLVLRVSSSDSSLDAAVGDDRAWVDRLVADDETQEDCYLRKQLNGSYRALLDAECERLPERERHILRHRLLADEGEQASLADIGEKYGLSRERIRQIEVEIKKKLRARLAVEYRGLHGKELVYAS